MPALNLTDEQAPATSGPLSLEDKPAERKMESFVRQKAPTIKEDSHIQYEPKLYIRHPQTKKVYLLDSPEGGSLFLVGNKPFYLKVPTPVKDLPNASSNGKGEHSNAFFQHGNAPIKDMQQSIINIAHDLTDPILNTPARQSPAAGKLTGSEPFMNFLVDAYVNKADRVGKQFPTTDQHMPGRMEDAKALDNFKGILHTLKRIGTPNSAGGENQPDGDWGPRTNNALVNLYALAHGLINLQKDMNVGFEGYTEADLSELGKSIPKDANIPLNDKVERAQAITSNLGKLRVVYDSFKKNILNHSNLSAHIKQEKPLMKLKISGDDDAPLAGWKDSEKEIFNKHRHTEIGVPLNGQTVSVMPFNLLNMDNFKKFISSKAPLVGMTKSQVDAIMKGDQETLTKFMLEVAGGLGADNV